MPAPLSHRNSKLFVIGFLLTLFGLIAIATFGITRGMQDEEWQARIQASREAREAEQARETDEARRASGLDDPGEGGKAVRLSTGD